MATEQVYALAIGSDGSVRPQGSVNKEVEEAIEAVSALSKQLAQDKLEVPPMPEAVQNMRSNQIAKAREDGLAAQKKGDAVRAAHLFTISAAIAASRPVYQHSLYARKEISLALVHRASAYMALDNVVGALTDAETAIRINRPEPRGHLRKGRALVALGRPDEALDAYNLGLAFNSDNEELLQARRELEQQ